MSAAPEPSPQSGGHMTIWEHLAELRSRLIKCIVAVILGAIIGWFLFPWLFEQLLVPFRELVPPDEGQIIASSPLQPFATRLKVSGYVGVALAMPVLLWQLWRFVTPGLYPHEKKYALPFTISACVLFVAGAALAYITLNPALEFLIEVGGGDVEAYYTVDSYVMLIIWMMLAFGAGFEFPVLLVALLLIGVLTPRQLLGWWRQALVVITVAAAVITPSGDPITMLALGIPMALLYFVAIGVGAAVLALRRRKERRADGASTS
jgi:sec-independent protein translocase protein TatC